jgi:hypothetical protein
MAYLQSGQADKAVETSRRALSLVPAVRTPSTGIRKLIEEMLAQSESTLARRRLTKDVSVRSGTHFDERRCNGSVAS